LPLSEKVRLEIFIPDSPDIAYRNLLDELGTELSYAFGGCTEIAALGKYRSFHGPIFPDQINILFSDIPLLWERDQLTLEPYIVWVKQAAERAHEGEEVVLVSVYSVCHAE
jgi:hypothetical protein